MKGIKSIKGSLGIALFNTAEGFPKEKALKTEYVKVKNTAMELILRDIPFGVYAVVVYQDENDNKKMDKNFFGIPVEGIGVSNNAKGHFGPPEFEEAQFTFSQTDQLIPVSLSYF